MKIQVFGSGCDGCKKLYQTTQKIVATMDIKTDLEYITDVQKIVELDIMQLPAMAINGRVVFTGKIPNEKELNQIINNNK